MSDLAKTICFQDELETALNLIKTGFCELQEMNSRYEGFHLPQQLIASGFERLFKCYFCLVYKARNGNYPDPGFLKKLGHDLEKLKGILVDDYFSTNNRPQLCDDLEFLRNDSLLNSIIHILSEFGQKARYYNLDIITGSKSQSIDPQKEWEKLKTKFAEPNPDTPFNYDAHEMDFLPRFNAEIISKLERMARAIAMQFTLGGHGEDLRQMSSTIAEFRNLRNEEFGTVDYRNSVKKVKEQWVKRSKEEVLNSPWPSRVISKDLFGGEWPFRFDEVLIECRDDLFCVINIAGHDFALNGATKSRFEYPDPHDAGVAILGKSMGPFIDMAFSLCKGAINESKP